MAQSTLQQAVTVLTTSTASVVASGASEVLIISKMVVCNTDTTARTIDIHAVPSAGSATTANLIVSGLSVGAGDTATVPGMAGRFVPNGASLHAKASAGSVVNLDYSYQRLPQ